MKIYGFNKTTLLDYPEHVASTIFTGGCNFRCPFCHNKDLVLLSSDYPQISEEEILTFLKKRKGILTGVCITGGEPTLQADLPEFLQKIKEIGYLIKLDTNGYQPAVLQSLIEKKLVDYIAMDIKTDKEHYADLVNIPHFSISNIEESISFIMHSGLPYEFRTTVVKELHNADTFLHIRDWIGGASAYYLQNYKDSENVLQKGFHGFSKEELQEFLDILAPSISHIGLRGID